MAKIGYVRVSTKEQNTDRQEIALRDIGMDRMYVEKLSGASRSRPELDKMLEYVYNVPIELDKRIEKDREPDRVNKESR